MSKQVSNQGSNQGSNQVSDDQNSGDKDSDNATPGGTSLFVAIGGEAKWRELVDRFYDQMDLDPRFAGIRKLHPNTLDGSRDKLYWFLCGWSGGPNYYIEKFGHPRLRARHMPYSIAVSERDQWLVCMAEAMQEVGVPQGLFDRLLESFAGTADWMRNTA